MILGLLFAAVVVWISAILELGYSTTIATITTPTYNSGVVDLNRLILPVSGIFCIVLFVFRAMKSAG